MENTKKQIKDSKKDKAAESNEKKNEGLNSRKDAKEETTGEAQENKAYGFNKPKIQCVQCSKMEVKHKIYKCFSCGNFNCFNCASLDTLKTKQNIKGESYICDGCFNTGPKNRKKNSEAINYNQFLNPTAYLDKTTISNQTSNSKEIKKNENLENPITMQKQENNQTTNKNKLIGRKRNKESDIFDMSFIEKDAMNLDRILDIDKLHSQVAPPNEIFTDTFKQEKNLYRINSEATAYRKSVRQKKPTPNNIVSIINCHQCKKIDVTTNILTCANDACRESFCINCTKKYIKGSSISKFLKLKSTEENDEWVCFKCKDKCTCKICKEIRQNHNINFESYNKLNSLSKERNSSEKKLHNNSSDQKTSNYLKPKTGKYSASYKKKLKSIKKQIQTNNSENQKNPLNKSNTNQNQNQNTNQNNNFNFKNFNQLISSSQNPQTSKKQSCSNMIITIPNIDLGLNSISEADYAEGSSRSEYADENKNENESKNKKLSKEKKRCESYNKTEIDNFLIYEVKEKAETEKSEFETIIDKEEQLILKDQKLYSFLVRAADEAEKFYFSAAQSNSISENNDPNDKACLFCNSQSVPFDALLQFKNFEHFLTYLKFIMIFRRRLLMVNEKKFTRNLIEIFDFIDAYDDRLKKRIYFTGKKFCCKFCLLSSLNKTNLLIRVLSVIKLSLNSSSNFVNVFGEEKVGKLGESCVNNNRSGNFRFEEDLLRSNSGKLQLNSKNNNYLIGQNTYNDQNKSSAAYNLKTIKQINSNNINHSNQNINKIRSFNSNNNSKSKTNNNNINCNTIDVSNLNCNNNNLRNAITKPNQNLPNDLINFNDKPDSNSLMLNNQQLLQDNSKNNKFIKNSNLNAINNNKNQSGNSNVDNNVNNSNIKKNLSSNNNILNWQNQNLNKINQKNNSNSKNKINNPDSLFTSSIGDFKFLSNPNNYNIISSNNLNRNKNLNSANNAHFTSENSDNKQNPIQFQDNSSKTAANNKHTSSNNNFNILNNTNINNNNNLKQPQQPILNSNPVSNGLNLNLIITKMLNMKRHFDAYYSLFSSAPSVSDPDNLKKCMLETNTLITDLLKHLNILLDEVRKYSYYLSLVFTKTDKLKDSINEIFPHLETIVSQVQLALQQGDEKLINGLGVTLGHAICVNDLLRLCKFELNDVHKVKNYARDNIVSEDLLRIFTVFLNLGKNQSFVSSLLGLFRNVKEAVKEESEVKGKDDLEDNYNGVKDEKDEDFKHNNRHDKDERDEKTNKDDFKKNENSDSVEIAAAENKEKSNEKENKNQSGEGSDCFRKAFSYGKPHENKQEAESNVNDDAYADNLNNNNNNTKKIDSLKNSSSNFNNTNSLINETFQKPKEKQDITNLEHDLIMKEEEKNENENDKENPKKINAQKENFYAANANANANSNKNSIEISNKLLIENNFSSPLLDIVNKIGLFQQTKNSSENGFLEPESKVNNLAIDEENLKNAEINEDILSDCYSSEIQKEEKEENEKMEIEIYNSHCESSKSAGSNRNEKNRNLNEEAGKEFSISKINNSSEDEKNYLLENIKKRIEQDCIPCKVINKSDLNMNIENKKISNENEKSNNENYINNKNLIHENKNSEEIHNNNNSNQDEKSYIKIENKAREQSLEINKILDMDNAEREKMEIDFETPKKKRDCDETSSEEVNEKLVEKSEAKFWNFNKTSNENKDKNFIISDAFEKEKNEKNDNQMNSSFNNFCVKNDNNVNTSSSYSHQRKKEENSNDSKFEANHNLNLVANNIMNINSGNKINNINNYANVNQNSNAHLIFKSTKLEPANKDSVINTLNSNNNHYNALYDSIYNTNNLNISKNPTSKFCVLSSTNNNLNLNKNNNNSSNNNNTNQNQITKAKLNSNHTPNITSNNKNTININSNNNNTIDIINNLNIKQLNYNNQIKSEEKKKVVYYCNDPDDSGNIQEHFNVNGQHDNIINDEPIKNTIFKPGFENLNETSSPRFYGNRSKNSQNNVKDGK